MKSLNSLISDFIAGHVVTYTAYGGTKHNWHLILPIEPTGFVIKQLDNDEYGWIGNTKGNFEIVDFRIPTKLEIAEAMEHARKSGFSY
jgi:hypothetical protein